jgi:molecular chaperone GrpE (heat shock protein)
MFLRDAHKRRRLRSRLCIPRRMKTVIEQHSVTRIEIIEAIQITGESSEAAQQATQQEISQLKVAIQQLSDQMQQKDTELRDLLKAFRETRSQKKRKVLQEMSNAVSATLLALEVMYRSLQVCCIDIYT